MKTKEERRIYDKKHRKKNLQRIRKIEEIYRKTHKEEIKERQRIYREVESEKIKGRHLKHAHNITLEEYNIMLENQNYKCAICGKEKSENGKSLAVDHNHETGKIRGLLCSNCNAGIGYLGDSAETTANATSYLISKK